MHKLSEHLLKQQRPQGRARQDGGQEIVQASWGSPSTTAAPGLWRRYAHWCSQTWPGRLPKVGDMWK